MAMIDEATNWTDLHEFSAVDLERSFVVGWETEGDSLLVDLDVFLLPEHPFYEEPRPAEGACYRQGVIEFGYCTRIGAPGKGGNTDKVDEVARSLETGRIGGLRRTGDGEYEISGEFGTVGIRAERPLLRFTTRLV